MTDHPITPPPELVKQWWKEAQAADYMDLPCWVTYVATRAAQWGADQELAACCDCIAQWYKAQSFLKLDGDDPVPLLRIARRPKPPSLKEQALGALGRFNSNAHTNWDEMMSDFDLLRRAAEQLDG